MIRGIKFVNIPVADQARALKFYTEKLGFTVRTDQSMGPGGQRWIELRIPGAPKSEPWGTSVILKDSEGNQLHIGSR